MGKKFNVPKDNNIMKISLEEAMSENYLPYAVEVAKDRALPDVRDGMKPVHRRILYGAYNLKAHPDRPYLKSARIVGDILGRYHPHGDSSVYDAMVILAQDFSTREQLIDGHGNWGSVDGDNAAAMRYTEARLSKISMEMLRDIDHDVVNMVDNYSNSEKEPEVLPARFPNLLVNGCFGIAVGLSTNIPPHNLGEVIDGVIALADKKEISDEELMEHIKGPDLPTGGILMGAESIKNAYATGKGKVTSRAKTSIEKLESGRMGIVITEFPYRKNKARLLHSISEMTGDKRHAKMLEGITDIRDESDRHGIRSVIEFKKSCEMPYIEKTLKYLFKKTDLQCNVNFNMISLVNGKPEMLGLKEMLVHYLNHQKEVITRRTRKYLETAEKRFHIVQGLMKAIGIMDEVIRTIRESKSKKDANNNLQEKFGFTEEQSTAILEMMLYRLTGLEIVTFEKEYNQLEKAINKYNKILSSEKELLKLFKKEILEIKEQYGNERRTEIVQGMEDCKIDKEELIIVEDVMITVSNEGYIKRIPVKSFNRTSGDVTEIEYREGDFNTHLLKSNTKENVLFFTDKGEMFRLLAADIPEKKWREKGERLDMLLKGFNSEKIHVIDAYSVEKFSNKFDMVFVSSNGGMRTVALGEFKSNYSKISAVNLKGDDRLVRAIMFEENREKNFISIETNRNLKYSIEEPILEKATRNSVLISTIPLIDTDKVNRVEFNDKFNFETFAISISKKGEIFKEWKRTEFRTYTETNGKVLLVFNEGTFLTIPSFILQDIHQGAKLEDIVPNGLKLEQLVSIEGISQYDGDKEIIIPTQNGLIKRCKLEELIDQRYGYNVSKVIPGDVMLKPIIMEKEKAGFIIIGTENGRVIKFANDSLSTLGKTAKGVISISLKEEDKVKFAECIKKEESTATIVVRFANGTNSEISIDTLPLKSRGTVGTKVIDAIGNDGIKEIKKLK